MDNELLEEIKKCGGVIDGHFIGNSGKHLSVYLAKDNILPHTDLTARIGKKLAEKAVEDNPEIVIGPVTSGVIVAQWTGYHLSHMMGKEIPAVFTDEIDDQQVLKRGYDKWIAGKRVVIAEDVVNTGKEITQVVKTVREAGGEVVRVVSIFNRGDSDEKVQEKLGAPYCSLIYLPLEAYDESEVPEWLQKIPISTEYGHGTSNNSARKDN